MLHGVMTAAAPPWQRGATVNRCLRSARARFALPLPARGVSHVRVMSPRVRHGGTACQGRAWWPRGALEPLRFFQPRPLMLMTELFCRMSF